MSSFAIFFQSIATICTTPKFLLLIIVFTAIGILCGALPGISVNMTLILALPLTYSMNTETAMCVLMAAYVGAMSGGLISAILLNIPGTGSSITTTFDGHPMAMKGEGEKAVGVGILTSFVGGGISFILLLIIAPIIAKFAMKFGPWEYFAIGIFSTTMIINVAGNDLIKGILAAVIGMCFAVTGAAPVDQVVRYNFGLHALDGGITTSALMCGMFAIPQILKLAANTNSTEGQIIKTGKMKGFGISFREYLSHWKNIIRSAVIGSYVGILPGIGGSSASIMAYLTEKKLSKHPEKFGTGVVDGVIASETANNACIGGAMIPMLSLGIPGSSSAAILMSALTLHGIHCGPLAFTQSVNIIYFIFALCLVANVCMLIIERGVLSGYIRVLTAPRRIIMVVVILMCFLGAYCSRNNYTDAYIFVLGGAIGYVLQKRGFSIAPIILGYILGGIIEENLQRALSMSVGNFWDILTHPIAVVFLIVAVIAFSSSLIKAIRAARRAEAAETAETEE